MIWPNHRQMVESMRRQRAADLGVGDELVQALLALEPPCGWKGHSAGTNGCEPDAPAEYVIRIRPHCARDRVVPVPIVLLICQAQQIRLRGRRHEGVRCACGLVFAWASTIDFLGPVIEYYP